MSTKSASKRNPYLSAKALLRTWGKFDVTDSKERKNFLENGSKELYTAVATLAELQGMKAPKRGPIAYGDDGVTIDDTDLACSTLEGWGKHDKEIPANGLDGLVLSITMLVDYCKRENKRSRAYSRIFANAIREARAATRGL